MVPEVVFFFFKNKRIKGITKYLVNGVMSLCKGCKTAVSIERESPNSFSVEVGFHSGSALKPTSFVIVMDVLTDDVRNGSLLELLCADSLAL